MVMGGAGGGGGGERERERCPKLTTSPCLTYRGHSRLVCMVMGGAEGEGGGRERERERKGERDAPGQQLAHALCTGITQGWCVW